MNYEDKCLAGLEQWKYPDPENAVVTIVYYTVARATAMVIKPHNHYKPQN